MRAFTLPPIGFVLAMVVAAPLGARGQEPSAPAGDYRWSLTAGCGPAAIGAPGCMFGAGMALGSLRALRVDLAAQLGWSRARWSVPVQDGWSDDFWTFTSATASARTFLFEVTGALRLGPAELWAGGGLHTSFTQWDARYDVTRCNDLLCFDRYRTSDTDSKLGSFAVAPLVSAGLRYPLHDHLLLGADVRYLVPAGSWIGDRYRVSTRLGGASGSVGLTVRFGAPLRR